MLVGFKPRNHRHQVTARGFEDDDTDDRRTPSTVFDPLHAAHGFTLDVAANAENTKCARYFDRESNGLTQSWADEVVWCNPPYSALEAWARKALHEVENGCPKVVMLLPANRTEQVWWQELIEPVRDRPGTGVRTHNLRGRVRFGTKSNPTGAHIGGPERKHPDGRRIRNGTSAPFGLVLVILEPRHAA